MKWATVNYNIPYSFKLTFFPKFVYELTNYDNTYKMENDERKLNFIEKILILYI